MACACRKKSRFKYVWTSADGETTVEYSDLVVAKAKVKRKGGSFETVRVS